MNWLVLVGRGFWIFGKTPSLENHSEKDLLARACSPGETACFLFHFCIHHFGSNSVSSKYFISRNFVPTFDRRFFNESRMRKEKIRNCSRGKLFRTIVRETNIPKICSHTHAYDLILSRWEIYFFAQRFCSHTKCSEKRSTRSIIV